MTQTRIVLIGFTICILYHLVATQHCTTDDITGTVISCSNDDDTNFNLNDVSVSIGTKCIVADGQTASILRCVGPSWKLVQGRPRNERDFTREPLSRRKRGLFSFFKHIVSGVVHGVACVVSLFKNCRSGPPPDRTAPVFSYCPQSAFATADPLQTWAKVTWQEPVARDDVDGQVRTVITEGRHSGRHFPGDTTTKVRYMAKDRSGNTNYCEFPVHVKVIWCPHPEAIRNGYYSCYPATEFMLGSFCHFGCYDGFDLTDPHVMTCQANASWSHQQPICKAFKCPPLKRIEGAGLPSCTHDLYFRSICTYTCMAGYDMPPNVSKALVCTSKKTWRQFGQPRCVDVESPSFQQCPNMKIFGTDTGLNTSIVDWEAPTVTDNSGLDVTVQLTLASRKPGEKLKSGTYTIEYMAQDKEGNEAPPCKFNIIVRDVRCPRLYATPYQTIMCPSGYRSGSICNVGCRVGKSLSMPSDKVQCRRKNAQDLFGDWDWSGGQQATCIRTHKCERIPVPLNGAVACDNWLGGKYCQLQCRNGTSMAGTQLTQLYVCTNADEWMPQPSVMPCNVERYPQAHLGIDACFYFPGECTTEAAKEQIAEHFISSISTSLYGPEICPVANQDGCRPGHVQITCGESSRQKRSENGLQATYTMMNISFQLPIHASFLGHDYAKGLLYTSHVYDQIVALIENKTDDLIGNNTRVAAITNTGINVNCPIGSVKSESGLACLDCPEGTYFSQHGYDCQLCPKGSYQDSVRTLRCIRCPDGTTTRGQGSTKFKDCEDACLPGSYSDDGILPCSPCDISTYQPSYGQTSCHTCRGSKSTHIEGASSSADCQEFDIMFSTVDESSLASISFRKTTVMTFTLTFWVQVELPWSTYPTIAFYNEEDTVVWTFELLKKITYGHITILDRPPFTDNRWHHISVQTKHCTATIYVDGTLISTNQTFGNCSAIDLASAELIADEDFKGGFSQLNIWRPLTTVNSYAKCFSAEVGDIVNWQLFSDSHLIGGYIQIPSYCDDFNNCISSPCENGGQCTDALNDFNCACPAGFTGNRCEENLNDCETNICMHGSTCVDGISNYTCACRYGFSGTYCEIQVVDGKWSSWGNWSECTLQCGNGEQTRKRLCNSPTPDNGGNDCEGPRMELRDCNTDECPVCPEFKAPGSGSISCVNTTDFTSCTLACDEGHAFDIEPLPVYFCGKNTTYEWNFQNDLNPIRHTPNCVAIENPGKFTLHYSAEYEDLFCMSPELQQATHSRIRTLVTTVMNDLACIKNGTCTLDGFEITNCEVSSRERRQIQTAGFIVTISSQSQRNGSTLDLIDAQNSFRHIQQSANDGKFTADILDDVYQLVSNSSEVSGDIVCGPGMTRVQLFCVPCGPGTYLFEEYCRPCDIGLYQASPGSSSCIPCPNGMSTVGILSKSKDECIVEEMDLTKHIDVTAIIIGSCAAALVCAIVVFVYRRYRSRKDKTVGPIDAAFDTTKRSSGLTPRNIDSLYMRGFYVGISGIVNHLKPWK